MRILVTGAAGFIGSHLCDQLLESGAQVVGIDNLTNGKLENINNALSHESFEFYKVDIRSAFKMQELLKGVDIVYHLACLGVRHSLHSPEENHEVNATGSLNILEAAKQNSISQFFYISTSEVYGRTTSFPISEESPTLPLTVYGASKLAGENYALAYHECFGLNVTILRIFNNYGPRAHYEGDSGELIPRSIVKLLYNEPPTIFGDGSLSRDFFYVKDTAKILSSIRSFSDLNGKVINIGTGDEISVAQIVHTLKEIINPEIQIQFLDDRPADVPRLWVDNRKMNRLLGYKPSFSLEKGIEETIAYYRELASSKNLLSEIPQTNWK